MQNKKSDSRLPELAKSFQGKDFDPRLDKWVLRDAAIEVTFNWNEFNHLLKPKIALEFKLALLWFVENRSVSHASNIFDAMKLLLKFNLEINRTSVATIDELLLTRFRTHLGPLREWRLGNLRGFFKRWYAQGYGGLTEAAMKWLQSIRLKGNPKGEAVKTQDPRLGPFTQNEAQAIQLAVNDALATGQLSLQDHVLVTLISALGSRSVQMAALKCRDLRQPVGAGDHVLDVPRSKQRLKQARAELRTRPLIPELAELVATQIASVQEEHRRRGLAASDIGDLPIFPNWDATNPPGFAFHSTGTELGASLSKALKTIDAKSERTGERINITARRFRYTVGTRAAEEGHGELVIAELLDHSDIQQVAVYVMATQKIVERISKAMALQLAPLAQAFCGELIDNEDQAIRGGDPTSRIREPDSLGVLGNCGRFGFCAESAPVACYTCRRFQPWVDAPHEQVLDSLLLKRERVHKLTGDLRIASVADRTILAAADVVRRCAARRARDLE
jgi:integrase